MKRTVVAIIILVFNVVSLTQADVEFQPLIPAKTITIDGYADDRSGIQPLIADSQNDSQCGDDTDIKACYKASDDYDRIHKIPANANAENLDTPTLAIGYNSKGTKAYLTWSEVDGADAYKIYVSDRNPSPVEESSFSYFIDTAGMNEGGAITKMSIDLPYVELYVSVKAYANGHKKLLSDFSNVISIRPDSGVDVAYLQDDGFYHAYIQGYKLPFWGYTLGGFEIHLCFALSDTDAPAYSFKIDSISRDEVYGTGDWTGYVPKYYDQGAFTEGDVVIRKSSGEELLSMEVFGQIASIKKKEGVGQTAHLSREEYILKFQLKPETMNSGKEITRRRKNSDSIRWKTYLSILDELETDKYDVYPIFKASSIKRNPNRVTLFMRHDMDLTMMGAIAMATEEKKRGLKATYYINMASSIYALTGEGGLYHVRPGAISDLKLIQSKGHEIGFHTDALFMALMYDTPMKPWIKFEIARLRDAGITIVSQAENGSIHSKETGSHNSYTWTDYRYPYNNGEPLYKNLPNGYWGIVNYKRSGLDFEYHIPDISLKEIGINTSAYRISEDFKSLKYLSDTTVMNDDDAVTFLKKIRALVPGDTAQVLTHPIRWTTKSKSFYLGSHQVPVPNK